MDNFFKYARAIIAFLIVLLSFGFLYLIALRSIPVGNKDVLQVAAGIVLGALAFVTGYYFGSSKDKSDQDKALTQTNTQ
jgi:hypothetical protein